MSISVIIPSYNREKLLPLTLRSLLAQTVPADEIIVVDDGSTDGTAEVVESFGGTVRLIRQANGGPAAARNTGFRASQGEFIHFFDSDDVALPNKHEVQLRALVESSADIAYGPWVKGRFRSDGFVPEDLVLQQYGLPKGGLVKALLTDWSVVPHACLFRREIVEKAGGFPEDLFGSEDQLMFLNCLLAGAKVVHSPGTLELYRADNAGKITASNEGKARQVKEWAKFLVAAEDRCAERGINVREWFGFRLRVWEALDDFQIFGIKLPATHDRLQDLLGSKYSWFYPFFRGIQRKRAGLSYRLNRGRHSACFRSGVVSPYQQSAIQDWSARQHHM